MTNYATLLRVRVTLQRRCIDRIFLQAYVPKLQGRACVDNKRHNGAKPSRALPAFLKASFMSSQNRPFTLAVELAYYLSGILEDKRRSQSRRHGQNQLYLGEGVYGPTSD